MKKEKAYKVVQEVNGRLWSLYQEDLDEYAIEYSDKRAVQGNKVSFVCDTLDYANRTCASVVDEDIIECYQIWECEGYFVDMPKCFVKRSVSVWLTIDKLAKFMKNVKLTTRIK